MQDLGPISPIDGRAAQALAAVLCLLFSLSVGAAAAERKPTDSDQDRARAALEAGRVAPLQSILDKVSEDFAGKMIQVELEDNGHILFYEVKLLTDDGHVIELRYDARSAALLNADAPEIAAARVR